MQTLVSSLSAGDCLVHRLRKNCSSFLTSAQDSHLQRATIPETAYIQLRHRPPEDEPGNARNMQRILINVLYVNKQEFCASSWRSNEVILRCTVNQSSRYLNPLNPELNPICYLLALLGDHHFLHVSRIRVKLLTLRWLMSYIYIYGAPILDVSRSHTKTQHSR